ncbi:fibronectin type III domain-containing protein [Candidatus Albibeggiatoa sp. nov. NOAA]|uniref:fibronectin type III domain-containing protein n=1 Tax=Candidatus Albibeggiatoa sp. nov. NOAA TaxID=3162724 RepID=UPI0032F22B4D|nr:fibronectin type III domain-containing protein [Thiotrichaceae bacterium]
MKHYLPHITRCLLSLSALFFSPYSFAEWTVVGDKGFKSSKLTSIKSHKVDSFSLASGKNNKLYITYTNLGTGGGLLTALEWDGTEWEILGQPDILGSLGKTAAESKAYDLDIQADHQDIPYITFGNTSRKASVIHWENNNWHFIGNEGFSAAKAYHLSLSISSENAPYVAYKDTENGYQTTMRYWNETSWESVGLEGFSGFRISDICTVLDSHDVPYVIQSYKNGGQSNINVMRWDMDDAEWVFLGQQSITPSQIDKFSCGMDKGDMPYVAYSDANESDKLTVMYWNNSTWTTLGNAGFTDHAVNGTSIVFDHNNMPYIGYQSSDDDKAYVMYWNDTTQQWVNSNDGAVSDGRAEQIQLAVDHDNRVYLAYKDYTSGYQVTVKSSEALAPPIPDAPSHLNTNEINDEVKLTWQDNSRNEVGFEVWRNNVQLTTTTFNKEYYVDTSVVCGTSYQYEVLATNAGGDSAAISTSITTASCPVDPTPLPPTNLSASAMSTPSITLNWADQSHNETAFYLWRDGEKIAEIAPNQTSFIDAGLVCGQSYQYELKAINNTYSSDSIMISATASGCGNSNSGNDDDDDDSGNGNSGDDDDTNNGDDDDNNSGNDNSSDTDNNTGNNTDDNNNTSNGDNGQKNSSSSNTTDSTRTVNTKAGLGFYILNIASPLSHIVSEPAGINCNRGEGQCQATFPRGTKVDLDFASPLYEGQVFTGWEGDLDCKDSKVTMNDVKHCFARIEGVRQIKKLSATGDLSFGQFSSSLSVGQDDHIAVVGFIFDTADKQLFAVAGQGIDPHVDPSLVVSELEISPDYYVQDMSLEASNDIYGSNNAGTVLDLDSGMYLAKIASETSEGQASLHVNPINLAPSTSIDNISTRGTTYGDGIFMRFTLTGEGTQPIMIAGEALDEGVNPVLKLSRVSDGELLAQNISWLDNNNYVEIQIYHNHPLDSEYDAAILTDLPAGEYLVNLSSAGIHGQAIVEVDIID